jgi:hypothetical protein
MDDCIRIGNYSIYKSMLLTIPLNEGKSVFVERRKKRISTIGERQYEIITVSLKKVLNDRDPN